MKEENDEDDEKEKEREEREGKKGHWDGRRGRGEERVFCLSFISSHPVVSCYGLTPRERDERGKEGTFFGRKEKIPSKISPNYKMHNTGRDICEEKQRE